VTVEREDPRGIAVTPSILFYARDFANICTLIGLSLTILGLYLALRGKISWAAIALLWAVNCDLVDGQIARRTKGRTTAHQQIGVQLDSLVDIVTSAVVPGVVLLALGDYQPHFLPGALALPIAAALRLSYFNVHSSGGSRFKGVPVYYNPIVLAAAVLAVEGLGGSVYIVYAAVVMLAALNLSSLDVPKQRGIGLWLLFGTTTALTGGLTLVA
jgi:CDP-diacylglycerol--serine O-phosphatidyltransferase